VYFAPFGVDKLFCAALLVLFWYSKADYFWFAFFIIISSFPAGLFSETTFSAVRRLPIYSPFAKISFTVLDLFLIISLIKAIIKGKRTKIVDVFKIKNIAFIVPYVFATSLFFGITLKLFINQTLRGLFFYTLFYSLPTLISNKKEVYKFMTMFFPFLFLEVIAQLYIIKTGNEFSSLFTPGSVISIFDSVSGNIRAVTTGYIIMRLAFVFAFVMLENKDRIVPNLYLLFVILISISSVVIAATRSAITMFLFIFIMYFIIIAKKKPHILIQIFILGVVLIFLLDVVNVFNLNEIVGTSYKRFIGIVSVEEGAVRAEDTFDNRISVRLPVLIDEIKNSFFIGYGFSDKYFQYYDGHLGGVLVGILQVGIFGYIIYLIFIVNIFRKCFKYIRKLPNDNSLIVPIKVFTLSFFGYLMVNLTVDPIFVLNTSTLPQDIFVHLVITTIFINLGMREQIMKRKEKMYALSG
ncbi:MAG: O-antigen ligase family protein, partial [Ignavibacteriae bacterium]|nr:O-antigen ligase family protein [Ignavibacteriota bacterium]